MKMMYVERVQVHSCLASFSSCDKFLYKQISKKDFELKVKNLPENKIEIRKEFGYAYFLIEDESYYNVRDFKFHATKQQMQEKVDFYKTFGYVEKIKEFENRKKACSNEEERVECERRKKDGFIFYTSPNWKYSREEARGGFSDELWGYEPVVKYTETHSFGYFGHSVRKPELDKYFERYIKLTCQCAKVDVDWKEIAYNYLSSGSARHFSDNLEGIDFSEQKRRIFSNLKSIWNQAYVYSLEEHEGTYDSTEKLMEKYKDNLFD